VTNVCGSYNLGGSAIANDLGHGSDHEDIDRLEKGQAAQKSDHLVCHEFSTHIPYLVRHYRLNLVSSLPRGMPMVVDESVEVRVREPDSDTEHKR